MVDVDTFLTTLYVMVDDFARPPCPLSTVLDRRPRSAEDGLGGLVSSYDFTPSVEVVPHRLRGQVCLHAEAPLVLDGLALYCGLQGLVALGRPVYVPIPDFDTG
jgi:hypothetical protein